MLLNDEEKEREKSTCGLVHGCLVDKASVLKVATELTPEDPDMMQQWLCLNKGHFQKFFNLDTPVKTQAGHKYDHIPQFKMHCLRLLCPGKLSYLHRTHCDTVVEIKDTLVRVQPLHC